MSQLLQIGGNFDMARKRYTQDEKYKMVLHSFYVLRSEIKFKNHELNLCEDKKNVVLKDLKTDKEYKLSIWDTMYVDAAEFISRAKQESDDILYHL